MVTLRELMHAFDVDKVEQNVFSQVIEDLSRDKRILRVKTKLYTAAPQSQAGSEAPSGAGPRRELSRREPTMRSFRPGGGPAAAKKNARGQRPEISEGKRERFKATFKPPGRSDRPVVDPKKLRPGQGERRVSPQVVGVLMQLEPRPVARIFADEKEIIVPVAGDLSGLGKGDAAVFARGQGMEGESLSLVMPLGDPKQPRVTAFQLAMDQGFLAKHSEQAEATARQFSLPALDADHEDIRHLALCTIDGEDAKDFDDAVFAEKKDGGFRLVVAIADVSHYVRPGNILDQEGYARGTSVYLPGFALPMLPHALSDDLCSLKPDVDRLCFAVDMRVSAEGEVSNVRSFRALMRSRARLTYREVEDALHKGADNKAKAMGQPLLDFAECARALRAAKSRRGALDLDLPEPQIMLDAKGFPVGSVARERLEAHRLIEDAMLACNSAVAKQMQHHSWPAAYRVHEKPNDEKLAVLKEMAATLGYRIPLPERPRAKDLSAFVRKLMLEPKGPWLLTYVLRSMARAHYSAEPLGHYALAEPDYLHFTSPIRRFPDLIVHRSLGSHGRDAPRHLAGACEHLSEREQSSEKCERQVSDHYRCLLVLPQVGEEFDATITSVLDFGAFAQVKEPFFEGLIPMRTLGNDYYELDHSGTRLLGRRSGESLGVGDEIRVRLKEVRLARRQIELEWVRGTKEQPLPQHATRSRAAKAAAKRR